MEDEAERGRLSSKLQMLHKDSHKATKLKPKVRIIHIFAPQIIETDVANFRELVQRLTGRPGAAQHDSKKKKKKKKTRSSCSSSSTTSDSSNDIKKSMYLHEVDKLQCSIEREQVIDDYSDDVDQIWEGENSLDGFLDGFKDLNGFNMHDYALQLPTSPHNMNMFEDIIHFS